MLTTKKRTAVGALVVAMLLWMVTVAPALADTCRVQMPASGYDPLGGENVTLPGVNPWTRLGQRLKLLYSIHRLLGEPPYPVIDAHL
jgi:hypothetical protein